MAETYNINDSAQFTIAVPDAQAMVVVETTWLYKNLENPFRERHTS